MPLRKLVTSTDENQLFQILLETIKHFNLDKTVIRVSGGWVRDKLLGNLSDDIDIALNDQTGKQFADYVNQYLKFKGIQTHRIGVIVANPEQSKHLETAKVKVLNLCVDFVNLRSETYNTSLCHRIPETVSFGTPKEDAERRDFTVNALFYNVNTQEVEDFTEKGLADLDNCILRTPMDPLVTFLDDPLRVLRAIRFATRLDFTILPEVKEAVKNKETKKALRNKVSRERVSVEIDKMLLSPNPMKGLELLRELRILDVIFEIPNDYVLDPINSTDNQKAWKFESFRKDTSWIQQSFVLVQRIEPVFKQICVPEIQSLSPLVVYYATILSPLVEDKVRTNRGKYEDTITVVLRDGLKQKNITTHQVSLICKTSKEFKEIFRNPLTEETKIKLGLLIRESKELWFFALLLSIISEYEGGYEAKFDECLSKVEKFSLKHFYQQKPLLNGREVMEIANVKKGGPILGILLNKMWVWQICNPMGTKQQVTEYMKTLDIENLN